MTRRPATDSPATDFAVALLQEFVRLGVREVVLAPGSRSQALALAAAELERLGLIRLRVRIDERVGGFLALGLAVESRRPVLVITTSGTAVANLHPAVLEAHHSGVPLIVITADRPEALRGVGSNQTTEQPGMFGPAVRRSWDVGAPTGREGERDAAAGLARAAFVAASGPVHLNLAFAEPLSAPLALDHLVPPLADSVKRPDTPGAPVSGGRVGTFNRIRESSESGEGSESSEAGEVRELVPAVGTVVVAGSGAGERAEEVARELGAPLIAEVASGAHFGPNLVVAYRELLRDARFAGTVDRVIVFGHPTLSREVPELIQRDGVETIVVRGRDAEDYNPGRRVSGFADAVLVTGEPAPRAWAGPWIATSRALMESTEPAPDITAELGTHVRAELDAVRAPVTRRALVEAVWRATWPHDRLVLGASRLIREMDMVVTGKRVPVHANRGLAGIDGTIATALGVALASQDGVAKGTTRVLLGDLALLHDVGALLFGAGEVRPRIQVIVGNDGGGTIFDGLEVARSAGPAFDRVMLTRQEFSLPRLAEAYGWDYVLVENRGALDQAFTASVRPTIVEVPLGR